LHRQSASLLDFSQVTLAVAGQDNKIAFRGYPAMTGMTFWQHEVPRDPGCGHEAGNRDRHHDDIGGTGQRYRRQHTTQRRLGQPAGYKQNLVWHTRFLQI
jgi:hypothetical protein